MCSHVCRRLTSVSQSEDGHWGERYAVVAGSSMRSSVQELEEVQAWRQWPVPESDVGFRPGRPTNLPCTSPNGATALVARLRLLERRPSRYALWKIIAPVSQCYYYILGVRWGHFSKDQYYQQSAHLYHLLALPLFDFPPASNPCCLSLSPILSHSTGTPYRSLSATTRH